MNGIPNSSPEIRFTFRRCGDVRLHVAEAGPADGPVVILLHGFPEFWFGWRHQIGPLAEAGYRVIAPDQRGYNLSDKPRGTAAYDLDKLRDDVVALADDCGADQFSLVGHDWGASVAWWVAQHDMGRLKQLVILNAPHPAVWRRAMNDDPEQRKLSSYVRVLGIPVLPELFIRAGRYKGLSDAFGDSIHRPDRAELEQYRQAWAQPGALTGMINWYRAILKRRFDAPAEHSIKVPVSILWGAKDRYSSPSLAEASKALCASATLTVLPDATHWIAHDAPDQVNALLLAALNSTRQATVQ